MDINKILPEYFRLLVVGKSGFGKTTWVAHIVDLLQHKRKYDEVILVSTTSNQSTWNNLKRKGILPLCNI